MTEIEFDATGQDVIVRYNGLPIGEILKYTDGYYYLASSDVTIALAVGQLDQILTILKLLNSRSE